MNAVVGSHRFTMTKFIHTSSLLSAVAALAMVAICVVIPKLEWILATVALAAFATVQYLSLIPI